MWKRLISEIDYLLLILLIVGVMGGAIYLAKYGNPYIGIPIWLLFSFLIFGGWRWIRDDKKKALEYLIILLIIYLIIIFVAIRRG